MLEEFKRVKKKHFDVAPYIPVRADSRGHTASFAFSNFSMRLKSSTSTASPPWAQNGHSPFAALLTTGEFKTHY